MLNFDVLLKENFDLTHDFRAKLCLSNFQCSVQYCPVTTVTLRTESKANFIFFAPIRA